MRTYYTRLSVFMFLIIFSGSCSMNVGSDFLSSSAASDAKKKKSLWPFPKKAPVLKAEYLEPSQAVTDYENFDIDFIEKPLTLAALDPVEVPEIDPYYELRDDIVLYAKQFLGLPYRYAGYSKRGFDCSGFTSYVMKNFGISLSQSSSAQARQGEAVNLDEVQKGDLLFFKSRNSRSSRVGHTALVISDKGEPLKMIHASRRGIIIDAKGSSSWKSYYKKRFLFAKRVIGNEGYSEN